jgi:hypothetical protein
LFDEIFNGFLTEEGASEDEKEIIKDVRRELTISIEDDLRDGVDPAAQIDEVNTAEGWLRFKESLIAESNRSTRGI